MRARIVMCLTVILSAALVIGCEERDQVTFYNAPKDPPPTTAPVTTIADVKAAGANATAGAKTKLHWDVPQGWKEMPAGQMRVAQFRVSDEPPVDVTVIPLGPESGALLPNVNRWERELGIAPSPQEKLPELAKQTKVGDLDVTIVDLKGAEKSTLAAIVPYGGRVWFFKLQGPNDVVARQKENFNAFIGTLHAAEEGHKHGDEAAAAAAGADPHAGHDHAANPHEAPAAGAGGAAGGDPHGGQPISKLTKCATPDGWREIPGSKPPRMLGLEVGSGEQKAEMIATRFAAGNTGSFADNITRWRQQISLPPVEDPRALPMKDVTVGKDGEGIALEMHNPENKKGVVVVIASARGDLWFFKFTGPSDVINAEREKFDAFIKSLEFGGETK
jgi:hypothetical protein